MSAPLCLAVDPNRTETVHGRWVNRHCLRPQDHTGPHRVYDASGNQVGEWTVAPGVTDDTVRAAGTPTGERRRPQRPGDPVPAPMQPALWTPGGPHAERHDGDSPSPMVDADDDEEW